MYITKRSFLFILVTMSLVILWCANADSSEQQQEDRLIDADNEESDEVVDVFHDASDYPFVVNERASLRPVLGKRASLRPFGRRIPLPHLRRRASLRPVGKRASLRPPKYLGKRRQRSIQYANE